MERYYSILLPGKLLIGRSDFSVVGRRALERITIMGLLYDYGGYRYLSVRKALEYIEKLGCNYQFKRILFALTADLIYQVLPVYGQKYGFKTILYNFGIAAYSIVFT